MPAKRRDFQKALNASLTPPEEDITKPPGADAPPQQGYLHKKIRAGRGRPVAKGPRMVPQGPAGEPESRASRALPAPQPRNPAKRTRTPAAPSSRAPAGKLRSRGKPR